MKDEKKLILVDCGMMWPDYWQGTSGVGLFIYPDNETTVAGVRTMLEAEISDLWSHIIYTFKEDFTDEGLEKAVDAVIKDFFYGLNMEKIAFPDVEFPTDEDEESLPFILNLELTDV